MLSTKKMASGDEDYYLRLAGYYQRRRRRAALGGIGDDDPSDDFGSDGFETAPELPTEPAGQWLGSGCLELGLCGIVFPDELRSLMQGLHPRTREPLVQNAAALNRVPGWDFTFSDPKSVSIVWTQADDLLRARIEALRQKALHRTIGLIEKRLAYSRVGKGGHGHVPVKLIIAAFEHCTSRNQDPQLHTHCLVLNVAADAIGHTRALFSRPLYVNRDLLGAFYRAALAGELRKVGFRLRKHGTSFEIVGVPQELIDAHSSRRQEIVAHLRNHGRSGGKAAAIAALDTRKSKTDLPPRDELIARWQERNTQYGFTDVNSIIFDPKRIRQGTAAKAIDAAINRLAAQESHFTRTDFQEAVLQEAPALGLDAMEALQAAAKAADGVGVISTMTTATLVDLGVHEGQQRFTTAEILEEEQGLLDSAKTLKSRQGALVPDQLVQWAIADQLKSVQRRAKRAGKKTGRNPQLTEEQRAAVEHLTQDSKHTGAIRILQGTAGTGKTDFVLAVCKRAWEDAGYRVIAVTPTAKAARVLQRDAGMDAQTVTKALGDYELPWRCVLNHHLRQLKNVALGRRTYRLEKPGPVKLDPKSIVVVDESSMLATWEFGMMLAHAVNSGATVIFAGDAKQNPPVGRGAPFLSLATRIGFVELTDIQRQEQEWARQVATHAAKGEVKEALSLLAKNNSIRVRESVDEAAQDMVDRWKSLGGYANPSSVIALANTNEQTEALNQLFQQERMRAGVLNPDHSIEVRDIDKEEGNTYLNRVHVGDQVLFTRNNKQIGVENGAIGTVVAIRKLVHSIAVRLHTGETVQVPTKHFPHVRLGYALTNYKAQGDGFENVLVLVTEAESSLPTFYVNVTRGKQTTTVFTTKSLWNPDEQTVEQSPLVKVLSRQPDLRLASDLRDANASTLETASLPPLEIRDIPEWPESSGPNTAPPRSQPPDESPNSTPPNDADKRTVFGESPLHSALPSRNVSIPAEEGSELAELNTPLAAAVSETSSSPRTRRRSPPRDDDDIWILPAGPAGQTKPRRKKRRPSDVDTAWDDSPPSVEPLELTNRTVDSSSTSPAESSNDAAVDDKETATSEGSEAPSSESSGFLPDSFLRVPIPSIDTWQPEIDSPETSQVVLPQDFLSLSISMPTARRIAGGFRPPNRNGQQSMPLPPLQATLTQVEAQQPSTRRRLAQQARQNAISQACEQFNVPADRIEIIDVEQWEEPTTDGIILWTRVTYRITTYGRNGLVNVADFPVPLW